MVVFKNDLTPRYLKDMKDEKFDSREQDCVMYEDYSPFMLIGENSLEHLNNRLEKKVSMRNFRPNFTVRDSEPFDEVLNFIFSINIFLDK